MTDRWIDKLSDYLDDEMSPAERAFHTLPEFEAFVNWLREETDRHGPTLAPERQERLAALFTEIAELEVAFFDEAYKEG